MLKQDIVRNLDRLSPESLRDVKAVQVPNNVLF